MTLWTEFMNKKTKLYSDFAEKSKTDKLINLNQETPEKTNVENNQQ